MKKQFYLAALFFCLLHFSASAQLQQGDWAPPFTLPDIYGNEYRLYDYLSQGKPVIIDFSAAWCPPCWDQHQSEVLQTIYEQYGPDGTDELMIFMIEADPENTIDHLYGTTGPSQGNWVDGTPYPIIDLPDRSVGNAYLQFAYPTIYLICPDFRVVGNLWSSNWSIDYVMDQVATCGGATPPENDVIVHSYQRNDDDCYSADLFVKVINGGTEPLTGATIKVSRAGTEITTLEWTGNLGLGEEEEIVIEGLELLPDVNTFTVEWVGSDEDDSNDAIDIPYIKAPNSIQELNIYFGSDQYVEEHNTRWRIENENGEIVAESGPLTNNDYTETTINLPDVGCHTFIITDDEGDGLIGDGFIVVSDAEDRLIYEEELFGSEGSAIFLVQEVVSVQDVKEIAALSVFPNPTSNKALLNLELQEATPVQISILALSGQTLKQINTGQRSAGQHQFELDLTNLANGVYFIEIQTAEGRVTKRVVKA